MSLQKTLIPAMGTGQDVLIGLKDQMHNSRQLFLSTDKHLFKSPAFICWYFFVLLCCIVPITVECYRRRRRSALQDEVDDDLAAFRSRQEAMNELLSRSNSINVEAQKSDEKQKILERLSHTKMTVKVGDIMRSHCKATDGKDLECGEGGKPESKKNDVVHAGSSSVKEMSEKATERPSFERKISSKRESCATSPLSEDESGNDAEIWKIGEDMLCINANDSDGDKLVNGGPRTVPNHCAICLGDYEEGDQVVWSSNVDCAHVFHENCMAMWLAEKNASELICPCCRQEFFSEKTRRRSFGEMLFECFNPELARDERTIGDASSITDYANNVVVDNLASEVPSSSSSAYIENENHELSGNSIMSMENAATATGTLGARNDFHPPEQTNSSFIFTSTSPH